MVTAITISIIGAALVSLWTALGAVALIRRGFVADFSPGLDGRSQLFHEDLGTVITACRKEIDANAGHGRYHGRTAHR